ncbi:hypothetical protein [Campylobacter concisus]|uniref:hypothetical protein n=1 Tax=Campylobacter concisus TaxID=199 RepID=UPI00165F63CE|nr:hypothetical protein [Campylobacter concisus]
MSVEFLLIVILAGWVSVNEWRLSRLENKFKGLNDEKLSRAKISELLEIPYPTLCDWGKREADNWRYKLHKIFREFKRRRDRDN